MATEQLRLIGPDGKQYVIIVSTVCSSTTIELTAICEENSTALPKGTVVAHWRADFQPPVPGCDPGYLLVGGGRIDINVDRLRGIGLGSLLMRPIILWIKTQPNVPIVPIILSADDAQSESSKSIRNRFYEKLGFEFDYKDGGTWGESLQLDSHKLITPEARLSHGWTVISIVVRPPGDFGDREIDHLVSLVLSGGEVSPGGLRGRVMKAHCLAVMRRNNCLVGVAALKRPELSYRTRVTKGAGVPIPRDTFEFELGWVFILPSARGAKLSFPLCESAVRAADKAGIFATSRASNAGMHATMEKLGFLRAGSEWASKQVNDSLQLFVRACPD
jgi:GNAT superfamily N-acetyltransferase